MATGPRGKRHADWAAFATAAVQRQILIGRERDPISTCKTTTNSEASDDGKTTRVASPSTANSSDI